MHRSGASVGLAFNDVFHVALSMPFLLLISGCVSAYTILILIFTCLYMFIDHPGVECGVADPNEAPSFYRAFAFSLETMTARAPELSRICAWSRSVLVV